MFGRKPWKLLNLSEKKLNIFKTFWDNIKMNLQESQRAVD